MTNPQCSEGTLSYIQTRCEQALQNLDFDDDDDDDDEEKENANPRLKSTRIEDISLTEDVHTEVGVFIFHFLCTIKSQKRVDFQSYIRRHYSHDFSETGFFSSENHVRENKQSVFYES